MIYHMWQLPIPYGVCNCTYNPFQDRQTLAEPLSNNPLLLQCSALLWSCQETQMIISLKQLSLSQKKKISISNLIH